MTTGASAEEMIVIIDKQRRQYMVDYADLVRRVQEYRVMATYGDQVASSLDNFDKQLPEGK
jgi:hypothetical protein